MMSNGRTGSNRKPVFVSVKPPKPISEMTDDEGLEYALGVLLALRHGLGGETVGDDVAESETWLSATRMSE